MVDFTRSDRINSVSGYTCRPWSKIGQINELLSVCEYYDGEDDEQRFLVKHKNQTAAIVCGEIFTSDALLCKRLFVVYWSYVARKFQGFDLATEAYSWIIRNQDLHFRSDDTQSPGGMAIWRRLAQRSDITVSAGPNAFDTEAVEYCPVEDTLVCDKYKIYGNSNIFLYATAKEK